MFYKFPNEFLVPVICVDGFEDNVNDNGNRCVKKDCNILLSRLEEGVEYITMKNLWNELDEEYANNETKS